MSIFFCHKFQTIICLTARKDLQQLSSSTFLRTNMATLTTTVTAALATASLNDNNNNNNNNSTAPTTTAPFFGNNDNPNQNQNNNENHRLKDPLDSVKESLQKSQKSIQSSIRLAHTQIEYLRLVQVRHENNLKAASDRLTKVKTITSRLCDECFSLLLPVVLLLGGGKSIMMDDLLLYNNNASSMRRRRRNDNDDDGDDDERCHATSNLSCCSCGNAMVQSETILEFPQLWNSFDLSVSQRAREHADSVLLLLGGGGGGGSERSSGTGAGTSYSSGISTNDTAEVVNNITITGEGGFNLFSSSSVGAATNSREARAGVVNNPFGGNTTVENRNDTTRGFNLFSASATDEANLGNAARVNLFGGHNNNATNDRNASFSAFERRVGAMTGGGESDDSGEVLLHSSHMTKKAELVELAQKYKDQTASTLHKTEFVLSQWKVYASQYRQEHDKIKASLLAIRTRQKDILKQKRRHKEELERGRRRSGTARTSANTTTTTNKLLDCPICFEEPKEIVFQCGHQSCRNCSPRLTKCHTCRALICQRIKLYH